MIFESKPTKRFLIARRFKRLRSKVLLTQTQLGDHVGLHQTTVSRIERHRVALRDQTWERFAEYESKCSQPVIRWPRRWL